MTVQNIGVVGGGVYGTQMLKCFYSEQQRGRVNLVALADLSNEILSKQKDIFKLETYIDYNEMIENESIDAVAIATPDHLHYPVIKKSIECKKHILCQKPLDVNSSRVKELIKECRDNNLLLYVDFHKRFDPAHIKLKTYLENNKLGKLQYGSVHMEDKIIVPTVWLKNWAANSSPSWFLGVHFYDLVYWLTGLEPLEVRARAFKGKLESLGLKNAIDSIQVDVYYEQNFSMFYSLSWILPESFPSIVNQGIRLVGEDGIAEVDSQDRGTFIATATNPSSEIINPFGALEHTVPIVGHCIEGYTFSSISNFIDILNLFIQGYKLEELEKIFASGTSSLVATKIGEAVDQSIIAGKNIVIE